MRTFRYLSFTQVACAIVIVASMTLVGAGGILSRHDIGGYQLLVMLLLLALTGLVAITMYRSAIAHLRTPNRRTALVVALNSAVLLYFLLHGVLNVVSGEKSVPTIYSSVSVLVAWLAYGLLLKPAALPTFPLSE